MSQVLSPLQGTLFINHSCYDNIRSFTFALSRQKRKPQPNSKEHGSFRQRRATISSLKGSGKVLDYADGRYSLPHQEKDCPVDGNNTFPNVQLLAQFPKNELVGKVVMVRFDSTVLLSKEPNQRSPSFSSAISTIKYLCNCGAKVTLVSNWSTKNDLELLDRDSVAGWEPVDIGPNSLEEISSLLSKCEKILWIGPVQYSLPSQRTGGTTKLAKTVDDLARRNCDVTVVGNIACQALMRVSSSVSAPYMLENASIVWEILKGKKLPGLMALDKAYPLKIDWDDIYTDPTRPLVVDIGSGNGLFLFRMAERRKDLNLLGLEMNEKLVTRCLASIDRSDIKNRYFIATNATSTFRSIVSSYPGKLVLVSIQCPNPDFNKPGHRWSMLQRLLVEAIVDLLISNGKVFLQSDIEAVAMRMKEQFLQYGKGNLTLEGSWLRENPFEVRSDWEQHVIDRGDPMYRLMLFKSIHSE